MFLVSLVHLFKFSKLPISGWEHYSFMIQDFSSFQSLTTPNSV